jgi:hypothetical protein
MCRDTEHVNVHCARTAACRMPVASRVCPWRLFLWLRLRNLVFFLTFASLRRILQDYGVETAATALSTATHVWLHRHEAGAPLQHRMRAALLPAVVLQVLLDRRYAHDEIGRHKQCVETKSMCTAAAHVLQLVLRLQHRVCVHSSCFCGYVSETLFSLLLFRLRLVLSRLRRKDRGSSPSINRTCGPTQP